MKGFLYVTLILLVAINSSVDMVGLLSENRVRPCVCVCVCVLASHSPYNGEIGIARRFVSLI